MIACLLAVSLMGGTALPAAVWQCRHAARAVAASFVAGPAAMPCRMGGAMAPGTVMACCPAPRAAKPHGASLRQAVGQPGCDPMLIRAAALPVAQPHETHLHLRSCLSPASALVTPPAPALCPILTAGARRQRPPPGGIFRSAALSLPSLRAPPHAA